MAAPAAATSIHEEDALGKAYDGRLMRRLLAFTAPYRFLIVVSIVLLCLQGMIQLVGPFLTQRVIDVYIPAHNYAGIRLAAVFYALALIGDFTSSYGETWFTALLGQNVMRDLRLQIFTHLQRLPITFFDRNPAGRLITRVTSDVETLNELFTAGVVSGLGDLFTLFAIAIAMLMTDWRLAVAAFLVIPLVVLVSRWFRISVRQSYRDIRTRLARINAFLQERLTGMRIVQLFGRERTEAERFDKLNRGHLDANLRSITIYALYFPAIEILTSVALASLVVGAASRVHAATLTVGTVAAFLQLVRRFFQPLQDLSDKYNTLQTAMASSERIFSLLDTDPAPVGTSALAGGDREGGVGRATAPQRPSHPTLSIPAARGLQPSVIGTENGTVAVGTGVEREGVAARALRSRSSGSDPLAFHSSPHSPVRAVEVTFDDVWFAYDLAHTAGKSTPAAELTPTQEPEWVLKGVSFTVRPGETLAIVGHTGAGKTTIVNLLMRFYDPQRGRILVNGTDIRTIRVSELRSLIGYVQQDIFLFAGDVASNIRLSNPLTDEEVQAAATRVGANRIIERLPNGYHQVLGERGASISVGERQLLSFARAIAADPALLILDEATSAVDSEIEAEIQNALRILLTGRTTIAIAHRLSTIVDSTTILVMHHGEVVEQGTHAQLLSLGGLYDRLWRLQI